LSGRLIVAIISTLLEEIVLVVVVLWGLPQIGVEIPLPGLIILMVLWSGFAVFSYMMGSRALKRELVHNLPVAAGSTGRVVRRLAPDGMIKVRDELWDARSAHHDVEVGEKVIVIGHDGLKLIVKRESTDDKAETE